MADSALILKPARGAGTELTRTPASGTSRIGTRRRPTAEARAAWDRANHDWLESTALAVEAKYAPRGVNGIQTKLEVSEPGDPLEQEAEHVAEHVMRLSVAGAPPPKVASDSGERITGEGLVQRACAACAAQDEDQELQREAEPFATKQSDARTPLGFESALSRARAAGGEPLPGPTRSFMEPRFGRSFDDVRVHRDASASELAATVRAKAFTVGRDLFFGSGQFAPSAPQGQKLIAHELTHVVQQRAGMQSVARALLQRQTDAAAVDAPGVQAGSGGLLVDDEIQTLTSGQARKAEFLAELRTAVCSAADRELVAAGRDTKGCPFIERWLRHYEQQAASHVERAVLKFVPEAKSARSAREYIPFVAERVARGVRKWASSGEIPEDLPPELRQELEGGGGIGQAFGAAAASLGGALSSAVSAVGGALSAIGGLFFKAGPGGARAGADAVAVSQQLGAGRPLDAAARSRMESALGGNFGTVRVHDDARAAALSRELGAHAFTVGEHVAFAQGNYAPGTPLGDALLAHELAHVVQQTGGSAPASPAREAAPNADLEQDADAAALGALTSLYAPGQERAEPGPRLRTGLRLSRCASSTPPATTAKDPATTDHQEPSQGPKDQATPDKAQSGTFGGINRPLETCDQLCTPHDVSRAEGCSDVSKINQAWERAAKNASKAYELLTTTPLPQQVRDALKTHFNWDGKNPSNLPTLVSAKLSDVIDKMSEPIFFTCISTCPPQGVAQIVTDKNRKPCTTFNCFKICEPSTADVLTHGLLHEALHRVLPTRASDFYRGQSGYPGPTPVTAQMMPDPYASLVDDLVGPMP